MIGLYLIAMHLTGDFLLQSRWHVRWKLTRVEARLEHVFLYSLAFLPLLLVAPGWHVYYFILFNAAIHFVIDSRRYLSTPADWVQWQVLVHRNPGEATRAWLDHLYGDHTTPEERIRNGQLGADVDDRRMWFPPPNPWPPLPLVIDQVLHVVTLAILGAWLLT